MSAAAAPWAPWRDAVGLELRVQTDTAASTWHCVACSEPARAGDWLTWHVTFEAPGAVDQQTVLVHLPEAEPAIFVVPEAATAGGTRLTATFVVPDPGGD